MEQALVASLEAVAEVMENAQDPWWIIASAAVALHGADPGPVGDVDVLLSLSDARRIIQTIGLALQPGSNTARMVTGAPSFRQRASVSRWTARPGSFPIALSWGISCSRSAAPKTSHGQLVSLRFLREACRSQLHRQSQDVSRNL